MPPTAAADADTAQQWAPSECMLRAVSTPESSAPAENRVAPVLPKSVTHFGLNSIALAIVLATMYGLRTHILKVKDPMMALCAAVAIPVITFDVLVLKVHKRSTTGIDWDRDFKPAWGRVGTKLLGFVATLAPFGLAYWVFPEYNGAFYDPFYHLLRNFGPGLIAASILYFTVVDGHMKQPYDAYWQLGRVLVGHREDASGKEIANHYKGWLVKAFFFPLMFVWLNNSTNNVVHFDLSNASWNNLRLYDFLYDFIFFIDLLFTTVGYAACFKPLDTHIRTAEPSFLGWGVALFCYEPFFSGLFEKQYVRYGGPYGFGGWPFLVAHPTMRWVWAFGIIGLITIYVLATVAFGIRFSNLTHRGILTNGPYRYTKHPAYVSKNISWWMASIPFVVMENWQLTIKHCIALGIINFMYFMRAKTEEWNLSRDPTYVQYALWMNEHGALRLLNRISIFGYKPFLYSRWPEGHHRWLPIIPTSYHWEESIASKVEAAPPAEKIEEPAPAEK
jgi:protein-S-isoprenylcysteine O-methyltransferase Ste14